MAFDFNNLANSVSKSVSKLGQEASSVTKNVTGTMKYNGMISEQKRVIEAAYRELGRKYYNKYANTQNNEFPEEMQKINAAFKQIEFCEQQQRELASNNTPNTPNAPSGIFCTKCGARLNPGAAFCTKCGNKIERPQPVAPNQNNAQPAGVNETAATSAPTPQGVAPAPQAPQGVAPAPQAPQGAVPTPQAPQAPQGAAPAPQAPTPAPQASQGVAPTPATVGAPVQPNVSQEKICPSCGNKVGAEMMFCTQCGTKLK